MVVSHFVLVSGAHSGPATRFLLLLDIYSPHVLGCPPWRDNGCVIYSCNTLSLLDPSPAELLTTSYCLIWDSPQPGGPGLCMYLPQEQSIYTPGDGVPFLSPLTTHRATVKVFYPASTRVSPPFKFEFELYCNWWSVDEFVLVSGPFWDRWPDFKFLWMKITFFLSSYKVPPLTKGRACNLQCNHAQDP
jgi:hypothetical protein